MSGCAKGLHSTQSHRAGFYRDPVRGCFGSIRLPCRVGQRPVGCDVDPHRTSPLIARR